MKIKSKKIIIISALIVMAFFLVYYIVAAKNYKSSTLNCKNIPQSPKDETKISDKQWSIYHDGKYGFSVNYQLGSSVNTLYNFNYGFKFTLSSNKKYDYIINGGVIFSSFGPSASIEIMDNNPFSSLEEYFSTLSAIKSPSLNHWVINDKQTVDGYPAISAYNVIDNAINNNIEDFKKSQTTIFFKDKRLFIITTDGGKSGRDAFLNNFKFDK